MREDKLTRKVEIDLTKLHMMYGYNWEHITTCPAVPTTIEDAYRLTEQFRLTGRWMG